MTNKKQNKDKLLQDRKRDVELEESFDLCNCASSCDCTGVVPVAPSTEEEWESYDETYHFQPVPVNEKENSKR